MREAARAFSPAQCSFDFGFIETDNDSAVYIDDRYAHLSGLPHHFLSPAHICSDIIFGKWNAILAEPIFCHPAVSAAWCGVDCNRHISSRLVVGFCGLWLHIENNIYKVKRQDTDHQKIEAGKQLSASSKCGYQSILPRCSMDCCG